MSYGNKRYGTGSYKYGGIEKPAFTSAEHKYCLHYGITSEQGPGWAKRDGTTWVWPESQAAILTIANGAYREEIVYDESDGLPYIIDTEDGPSDSGMTKVWKDKTDPFVAGSGAEIAWEILFGEYTGELEQYYIDHLETFLLARPVDIAKASTTGYDTLGFPVTLAINFALYKDGNITDYADSVDVPVKRDIVVAREERGNAIQIGLTGTSAEFRLRKIESFLKVGDLPHVDPNLSEQDFQVSLSNLSVWLSRDSGLINRVTGQLISGTMTVISGPAGIADAGIRLVTSISLLNAAMTGGTLLFWRKNGYTISGVTLVDYGVSGDWILSYQRTGTIPANLVFTAGDVTAGDVTAGDVADIRLISEVLSDAAIKNYYDNITRHGGDVYLP